MVLKNLAKKLVHIKGMSMTNLKLFRKFYQIYPQIGQTLSDQFEELGLPLIGQTTSDQLNNKNSVFSLNPRELLTQLNFSHFIELIRVEDAIRSCPCN